MKTCLWRLACLLIITSNAHATLGGNAGSIESDRALFAAARHQSSTLPSYSVEEIATGASTIREFVSTAGIVFGVAWTGYAHPQLSALLGPHYDEYQSTARQQPRKPGQRNYRAVAGQNVTVETWGHMRKLQGRAYLPSLLPEGVTADEIK